MLSTHCRSLSPGTERRNYSGHFYVDLLPHFLLSTDHPVLRQAIQKIQGHALVYFDAIDASVGTAQDGYAFSCDAIELCGYILDPDADPSELQEYILDMQSKAKLAHDDSVVTLNKFREVRKGLIEVQILRG